MRLITTIALLLASAPAAAQWRDRPGDFAAPSEPFEIACVVAAADNLRARSRVEASNPRIQYVPPGHDGGTDAAHFVVDLDAMSAGLAITYRYICATGLGERPVVALKSSRPRP